MSNIVQNYTEYSRVDNLKPHEYNDVRQGGLTMDNKLEEKLFFSKEAAEYLEITPQRLNTLVK